VSEELTINAITKISEYDFRWWFVGVSLVLLVGFGWLVRYLVTDVRAARKESKDASDKFIAHLEKTNTDLSSLLSGTTKALDENRKAFYGFIHHLKTEPQTKVNI